MLYLPMIFTATATVDPCNYSEEDRPVFEAGKSPPIFLPQDLGSFSPAALDGRQVYDLSTLHAT